MQSVLARFRAFYGATPIHLLGMGFCFALVAYTVITLGVSGLWDPDVWWQSIAVWFLGAVALHDLVLFPLYALADRVLRAGIRTFADRRPVGRLRMSPLNYVRVPAMAVGLLFLLFLPGILKQGAASYARATGQNQGPFLWRWLVVAAVICALSALAYTIAHARERRRPSRTPETESTIHEAPQEQTRNEALLTDPWVISGRGVRGGGRRG